MIFLLLANFYVVQNREKVNISSSDDKILSSLTKKPWSPCTFLNHFKEANEELLCALFL